MSIGSQLADLRTNTLPNVYLKYCHACLRVELKSGTNTFVWVENLCDALFFFGSLALCKGLNYEEQR